MKKLLLLFLGTAFISLLSSCGQAEPQQKESTVKGHLFIIGGGDRPEYMMKRYIELAGGDSAKIVVVPFASGDTYETAVYQTNQFKEYGCANVDFVYFEQGQADLDSNLNKLNGATGVYFTGGDQSKLTKILAGTKFFDKIKEIHKNGGVVGGTSAGAAVMSKIMLTGSELINQNDNGSFPCIMKGNVETTEGFGFVEDAIIDQHFVKRKRENRLITLVIEHRLTGIGIDEATAIIVKPDNSFEVFGEGSVMVFEPDFATAPRTDKNGNLSADKIVMHILLSGDTYKIPHKQITNAN